jgi:predicted adenylyl cyclase CyaB
VREVELKAVVDDVAALRARLAEEGARLDFAGAMVDRRYDTPDRALDDRDHMLRLRTYTSRDGVARSVLDWKGPTEVRDGFKTREEITTGVSDPAALTTILASLGYELLCEIDREVEQYSLGDATLRIEQYPRFDVLVEVEGSPDAIERAIARAGMPRATFTAQRLPAFILAYEERTGTRAALSAREVAGDFRYRIH